MGLIANAVSLLVKGGYVMIPLMLCSVVAVAVLIERFIRIKTAQKNVSEVVLQVEDMLYERRFDAALKVLEEQTAAVARVIAAGIKNRHLGERGTERAMEEQGAREIASLNHRMGALDTVITVAPLLGLLGTVTGMISAFHVISAEQGLSTPTAITGGVAEALIATATGLAIAIFTLVGYNHLQERIKEVVTEVETRGTAMVNVLAEIGEDMHEVTRLSA